LQREIQITTRQLFGGRSTSSGDDRSRLGAQRRQRSAPDQLSRSIGKLNTERNAAHECRSDPEERLDAPSRQAPAAS
jgi:hypothetical protein